MLVDSPGLYSSRLASDFQLLGLCRLLSSENRLADRNDRVLENVAGTYYVDSSCIDCDVCRDTAPHNFTRSFKHAYSYVSKQPENETERAACEEAMSICPVEAIGEDG